MKPLSVAIVAACPFPANHGTPANIKEMSQALASLGHRVHVVTYPMGQDIPAEGITIHRAGKIFGPKKVMVGPTYYKPFLDVLLTIKLCRVIWREKIDIIHAYNYEGGIAGYIAKKITGRPMIYYAINTMASELPSYDFIKPRSLAVKLAVFLDRIVPRMGDHVTPISDELYDFLRQQGTPEEKMTVVPGGVYPEMFQGKDPKLMRDKYGLGTRPLVVYTGTLDKFQRVDYLIKAMRVVTDVMPDAVLLVVGNIINVADIADLKRLAAETGVERNIIFTDERPLEEMPYFLASADIAVIPRPNCPGFPIKLLNYMASGKAIVVFKGSAKGLKDSFNALIVENDDWDAFGRSILQLMKDPRMAKELGNNALATITGKFDWPTLARKIESLYNKILMLRRERTTQ